MSKSISDLLQYKTDELHFIQGALNNLELVKVAQEGQSAVGWSNFTSNVIRDLKDRLERLNLEIVSLEAQLGALAAEAPMSKSLSWG